MVQGFNQTVKCCAGAHILSESCAAHYPPEAMLGLPRIPFRSPQAKKHYGCIFSPFERPSAMLLGTFMPNFLLRVTKEPVFFLWTSVREYAGKDVKDARFECIVAYVPKL